MNLRNMIGLGSGYLMLGLAVVILLGAVFGIGYCLVYRRLLKGTKRLDGKHLFLGGVCLCYLTVVAGATLLSRGSMYREVCLHPFYSYRAAWNSQSAVEWRNLVLNIVLFVPWGILLPMWGGRFRKIGFTVGSGFLCSVLIESIQFVCSRGVVEFDDVFNNTLGTLIGYGLAVIWLELLDGIKNRKNARILPGRRVARMAAGILPLVLTVGAFAILQLIYCQMPYGILPGSANYRVNMKHVDVSGKTEWDSSRTIQTVYQTVSADESETLALAEELFGQRGSGVDESRTDAYQDEILYYSKDQMYSVWVDRRGLTYRLTDYSAFDREEGDEEDAEHVTEAFAAGALEKIGIRLPKGAVFAEKEDGWYEFTVSFLPEEQSDAILDGNLSFRLYRDGTVGDVMNGICRYVPCGEEEIISEEEAYQQVLKGEFRYPYQSTEKLETLTIKKVSLGYQLDSKGFYQPVYRFSCEKNGESSAVLLIPALP